MKIAVIGSRGLRVSDLGQYLPDGVTEIVLGGAKGVDACAREYALANGLILTEFLPEYQRYGRAAPAKAQRADHRLCRLCAGVLGRTVAGHKIRHRAMPKEKQKSDGHSDRHRRHIKRKIKRAVSKAVYKTATAHPVRVRGGSLFPVRGTDEDFLVWYCGDAT